MAHPAFVIEHQYAVTETLPQLKGMVGDGQRVPVLRDLRGSSYIRQARSLTRRASAVHPRTRTRGRAPPADAHPRTRTTRGRAPAARARRTPTTHTRPPHGRRPQERDGLLVGPYEEEVIVHTEWPEGPPSHFAFDLFPPALDRLESCLLSAMEVVPALETVGFKSVVNGPTIWTGDSLARCGRTRVPGYYDFNSLTYGVAQGLALSEYLGHIITEGEQPYDMATEFDPLRCTPPRRRRCSTCRAR
jgi:dimethylglycine dehydrogenase